MSKNVPMLCAAKTTATMIAALTGSPLQLEPTPGCGCPVCVGIIHGKKLAATIGTVQPTPAGVAQVLNGFAQHQAEQRQAKPIELQQGTDGIYR